MSDYLPEDVLVKILIRVPPKSLIQFKCVSKSWNTLISSSHFISLQTHHAYITKPTSLPSNQLLVRCTDTTSYSVTYAVYNDRLNERLLLKENIRFGYPFRFHFEPVAIGTCNGVLCLSQDTGPDSCILLWNPVIKRSVALPKPRWTSQHLVSWCLMGFGFDPVNNDYKVVRLAFGKGDTNATKVEVYSLSVRIWCEVDMKFPPNSLAFFSKPVFVNGNVNWLVSRDKRSFRQSEMYFMVFDISLEVFDEMTLPEDSQHRAISISLTPAVIRESLAVCKNEAHVCSVWVMNKYGDVKSWSKMFTVRFCAVTTIHGFRMNGDILLTNGRGKLVSYNLDTWATTDLEISGAINSFYVSSYVESLAMMNVGRASKSRKRERLDS